ncbi:MAG: VOC family protein [Actinomycetota bacterium]|nr:VOC family protein [Actinomycetota bacterium]
MNIVNALASVAVRDLETAAKWYERLLGPSTEAMPEVIEWHFERGGGLQVYNLPERAGRCSCTLIVRDVDEIVKHLHGHGLAQHAEPARHQRVDTIMIKDPDGNSIALSQPKPSTLAQ